MNVGIFNSLNIVGIEILQKQILENLAILVPLLHICTGANSRVSM
jgi:hypothetical protein